MKKIMFYFLWFILSCFFIVEDIFASAIKPVEEDSVKWQTDEFIDSLLWVFSKEYLVRIAFAVLAVLLTFVFARVVKDKLFWYLENRLWWDVTWKDEILWVINRTVNVIILVTWFSITLWVLWLDLSIFIGWIWFGIGFTLRVFLTNFISWVLMVTQWVYHPWDLVEVAWKKWFITKIYSLFTAIKQFDWVMFFVPNIKFLEENVQNFHTNEKRRLESRLYIDYESETVKTKEVIVKVLESFPNILKAPGPKIIVSKLWERGVVIYVRYWVLSKDNYRWIRSNVNETINMAFKQANIKMATPRVYAPEE